MNEDKAKIINGVKYLDTNTTYISPNVSIGSGSTVEPGVIISGNSTIGKNTTIKAYSQIIDSTIKDNCFIGQFSLIRNNTIINNNVLIGRGVEIKDSKIGEGSGIYHSGFIGNAIVGKNCKFGANVITANTTFDILNKNTVIGDNVKIGVGTIMVAPVTIGSNCLIGAATFINKDIEDNKIVYSKKEMIIKEVG